MDPAITIRDATEQDLPAILEIYNEVILNSTSVYSDNPHTLAMRQEWFNDRQAANFPVIVAVQGDIVVGFGSYGHFRSGIGYRFTAEHSVYMHNGYRGRGLSKLLLTALISHAKNAGLHALIAGIDSDNEISINLHKSLGFIQVGYIKEVGFKFGRWLDVVFLELLL
ncbi:MAG: N-acetyltransferase family protein [Bacteroidota bacterium]